MQQQRADYKKQNGFQYLTVQTSEELQHIAFSNLPFQNFLKRSKHTPGNFTFSRETRKKAGAFFFREAKTTRMIIGGTARTSLYSQIMQAMYRSKISPANTLLAVVICPEQFIQQVSEKVTTSYSRVPIDSAYEKVAKALKNGKPLSLDMIQFFDLYRKEGRTTRNAKRQLTNLDHLKKRKGLYVISERKKGKKNWRTVYAGMVSSSNPDLPRRIYHHFSKDRHKESPNSTYCYKLDTHEYRIGVVDICLPELSRDAFREHVLSLEKLFIQQFRPRDNVYHNISKKEFAESSKDYSMWRPIIIEGAHDEGTETLPF